jgi:cardiolipin synthase|tara:strand:+ start:1372 stop:1950 length:579 start_codon:yes stop_codon:yes gene_type:complete
MKDKFIFNIPNILSAYRLVMFPVILLFMYLGKENLFVIFLCISLVTDILDGFIARTFNMVTELGAKLDSLADTGTYILAIIGVFMYKYNEFEPYLISFIAFISLFIISHVIPLIRYKRLPSFHLYSWKIGGYIQGFFFFTLFVFDFYPSFYIFMAIWGITAFIEHIIIQFIIDGMRSNLKGLYWVLKERKSA